MCDGEEGREPNAQRPNAQIFPAARVCLCVCVSVCCRVCDGERERVSGVHSSLVALPLFAAQ